MVLDENGEDDEIWVRPSQLTKTPDGNKLLAAYVAASDRPGDYARLIRAGAPVKAYQEACEEETDLLRRWSSTGYRPRRRTIVRRRQHKAKKNESRENWMKAFQAQVQKRFAEDREKTTANKAEAALQRIQKAEEKWPKVEDNEEEVVPQEKPEAKKTIEDMQNWGDEETQPTQETTGPLDTQSIARQKPELHMFDLELLVDEPTFDFDFEARKAELQVQSECQEQAHKKKMKEKEKEEEDNINLNLRKDSTSMDMSAL